MVGFVVGSTLTSERTSTVAGTLVPFIIISSSSDAILVLISNLVFGTSEGGLLGTKFLFVGYLMNWCTTFISALIR